MDRTSNENPHAQEIRLFSDFESTMELEGRNITSTFMIYKPFSLLPYITIPQKRLAPVTSMVSTLNQAHGPSIFPANKL